MIIWAILLALSVSTLSGPPDPQDEYTQTSRTFFKIADTNKDDRVSRPEMVAFFEKADGDRNGIVSETEFVSYISATYPQLKSNVVKFMFMIDKDRDGELSLQDLDNLYLLIDPDRDGESTENEFILGFSAVFRAVDIIAGGMEEP